MTRTERNILIQFKLQGFWGKSGNLTKKQRLEHLTSLNQKGYLTTNCSLTPKAIQELNKALGND